MKKNCAVIVALLCCGFIFTSFSPSLDGRAVVAEEGVMPQGVFARTVGYLPGDSISVTNLAKKTTIDVLVIGALDPSEGIAILLTPEAAELLGMDKRKNNVVKVTKRSGQLDETVSGTAVIGNVIEDDFEFEDENEETETAEIVENVTVEEDEVVEPSPVKVAEIEEDESPEEEELFEEEYTPPVEEEAAEYVYEPYPEDFDEFEETEVAEVSCIDEDQMEKIPSTEQSSDGPVLEKVDGDDDFAPKKTRVASEKVDGDDLSECDFDRPEKEGDVAGDVPEDESVVFEPCVENGEDEVALNSFNEEMPPEYVEAEELDDCFDEEVLPTPFEELDENDEIAAVLEIEADTDNENVDFADDLDDTDNFESYDAIVLVPVQPRSPEESDEADNEEMLSVDGTSNPVEVSKTAETSEESAVLVLPVDSEGGLSFDKYMVFNLEHLESGKYYVQIGVYGDKENIRDILDKYSENYPIAIVPLSSGTANQVMIGPLNVDEYGTVLNRFKSYGYKDAFLRKTR